MIPARLVTLFARLQEPFNRHIAAAELAMHVNAEYALVFSKDSKTSQFKPAQGFQAIQSMDAAWQSFLCACAATGYARATLTDSNSADSAAFFGVSDPDGACVVVFRSDTPTDEAIANLQLMLPFLASKLSDEQFILSDAENGERSDSRLKVADMGWHELRAAYERAEQELAYRRDAENKLRVADRRKDEFIATVSHELRTPLNAILGWAELLHIKAAAEPAIAKGVEAIIRSAKTQANLINELLDTSSIVAGKLVLHMETLNLRDVLERARETVEPLALQKKIHIQSDFGQDAILSGDAARLRQVFWNLLCNAIKFTPEGGTVSMASHSDGRLATVTISDTGMGIEEDFIPYVFDRFRQADASLRRKYGGLGLGLSIARQFIEMHSGSVAVSSEGANKGTTFIVRLPHDMTSFDSTSALSPASAAVLPDLSAIHILAVDDDPDARELIAKMLQAYGARVTTMASATEALGLLKQEHYDVLLSDISMPQLDGISFIEQIRALPSRDQAQIPALALSAFSDARRVKQAHASGFDVVMTKPVVAHVLAHAVRELLEKYRNR